MTFHILGISGSPRGGGNTEILVERSLEPFIREGHQVHKFFLSEERILPCGACEICAQKGVCVIEDDMIDLFEPLHFCDGIVIGSPVYMRNITAQFFYEICRNPTERKRQKFSSWSRRKNVIPRNQVA
jgi:multimeric flavodoxin WrbA